MWREQGQTSRRRFLAAGAAVVPVAFGQTQPAAPPAATPPKKARVTSSLMLWTLKGSFEDQLGVASRVGFQSVELVSEQLTWKEEDAARYKKLAQSYGLTFDTLLAQHDWTKRPVTMVNPAHRDGFLSDVKESIAWCKKLNCPTMIVMSGNVQPGMTADAQHASIVEGGKRAAELAAAADITLILEPLNSKVDHKGYFLTSATEGLEVVKQVDNPHFRLLFDIYHEQVQNGNVIRTIEAAEPYVNVFHVADNPGRNDPGTGEIDYGNIYRAIAKTGYAGYIAMEYLPLGDAVESLTKAVTSMRTGLNAAQPAEAPPSA